MEFNLVLGSNENCVPEGLSIGVQPEAIGWSLGNVFSFIGPENRYYNGDCFTKDTPYLIQAISGIEMLLGIILVFLLGLGLRNQFRLR